MDENKDKPVKLRYTAKKVFLIITREGHKISYTSVKRIVHGWKANNTNLKEVFIQQVPVIGKRAEFDSIDEANEFLTAKLVEINSGHISKCELTPTEGLAQEKDHLNPLPSAEYNNYVIEKRIISKHSVILFEGNYYSVPETHQSRSITLKIYPR